MVLLELAAVDPLFRDKLERVECKVLPRSPSDGEVADDADPPVSEEAVPGGLRLDEVPVPASDPGPEPCPESALVA